jgi:hypothetical protein
MKEKGGKKVKKDRKNPEGKIFFSVFPAPHSHPTPCAVCPALSCPAHPWLGQVPPRWAGNWGLRLGPLDLMGLWF